MKNDNSKLKILRFLIVIFIFSFFIFHLAPALAQSPTPESTTPGQVRQEIKERVQERIEQIQEQFKKRAFWGTLKEISNSTLVLETPRGERRVKTDKETKFFGPGRKEIKFADLEIGNFIIALGFWQENGTLQGKRVIALTKTPKPAIKRHAVYGKVADISEEEKVLSLVHPTKSGITFEVKITDQTIITKKVEGPPAGEARKIKKVNFEAIEIGDRVVAVGTREKEGGTLTAKLVHVIPGIAKGLEKITPTPTEKVSPTPTKKPTPTPTE
ncbi:MAG: hypothetical protein ACOZBZ_03120 [Patescibacteria group bacterium]